MEKKKDKKRLIIILLLLVALVGVTGYGVYSYYYTQGTFDTEDATDDDDENVIRITGEFNPTLDGMGSSNSGSAFLGNGGSVSLECPDSTTGHETITCTTSVTVRNEGTTSIDVEVLDGNSSASSSNNISVSAENPTYNWGEDDATTISAGSSETLTISVDVNVGSDDTVGSSEAQLVTSPVESGTLTASVSFRLKATQENNND